MSELIAQKTGFGHESHSNKSVDWYTPKWLFDAINLQFDLDPCQPIGGIDWIPVNKYYTILDDGLSQEWQGNVWLNPPYGKSTSDWLKKMHLHRRGIALLFARTDCKWFHNYCAKADAILFLSGRIKFVDGLQLTKGSGAGSGSMLIAWGEENVEALKQMKQHGLLVNPTNE